MKWDEYLWRREREERERESVAKKVYGYAMVDIMGKRKENGEGKEKAKCKISRKEEWSVRTSVGVCATWWRNQDIRPFSPKKVLRNYASRSK